MKPNDLTTANRVALPRNHAGRHASLGTLDRPTRGVPLVGENTPAARRFGMWGMPFLLTAILAIAGCQQLPSDHWSRPCDAKTRAAGKCYPPAVTAPGAKAP